VVSQYITMNKLIYEYLNSKYPNEFTIDYINSREVRILYRGDIFLIFNPRSNFIRYTYETLEEIKNWFGELEYNEIRRIINNWVFNRYNTTNVIQFRNHIMNK
jgi:hypothetical protein